MYSGKGLPKNVGVMGGMGPDATVYFFDRLVQHTPASSDQEHLPITILNWPQIPDRTARLYRGGADPVPLTQKAIDQLAAIGCQVIAIPCVSMHYFLDRIKIPEGISFVSILDATAKQVHDLHSDIRRVGVLGTDLTIREKLFHPPFYRYSIEVHTLLAAEQNDLVMKAIYQVKAGMRKESKKLLLKAIDCLEACGSEAIISGCTEIPIVVKSEDISLPFIDCLDCLAKAVVKQALAHT